MSATTEIELLNGQLELACPPSQAFDHIAAVCEGFEPLLHFKKHVPALKKLNLFKKKAPVNRPLRHQFESRAEWLEALERYLSSSAAPSFEDTIPKDVLKANKSARRRSPDDLKVVIFGTPDSGKATFMKQLEIIYGEGTFEEESARLAYKPLVISQTIAAITTLIALAQVHCGASFEGELRLAVDTVLALPAAEITVAGELAIRQLWQSEAIQRAHQLVNPPFIWRPLRSVHQQLPEEVRRAIFLFLLIARRHHLPRFISVVICDLVCRANMWRWSLFPQTRSSSFAYFLGNVARITEDDFVPTMDDIVRCDEGPRNNNALEEKEFRIGSLTWKFITPHQMTERRKWIHQFDEMTVVLFFIDISNTSSLEYSYQLFDELAHSLWFRNSTFVVFFNKLDRFRDLLAQGQYEMPAHYDGPRDPLYETAASFFMKHMFVRRDRNTSVYHHYTCMADTENVNFVFRAVSDLVTGYGRGHMMFGRPFNVDEQTAVLLPVSQEEVAHPHSAASCPDAALLPASRLDAAQAARFTRMAQAEHASIASHSVFALQLLAVGAPLHLVALAHRAALDEIQHARLAFRLARRFSGRVLGPSRLPQGLTVTLRPCIRSIAVAAAQEACLGETLSTFAALEELRLERDAEICAALRTVVRDEARHCELGWRTVRWCIEQQPSLQGELREILEGVPQIHEFTRWLFSGDPESVLQSHVALVFSLPEHE